MILALLKPIINKVSSQYNIDVERIYAAGYSNGGMMAYGLANYRSDLIAAVASVSGAMLRLYRVYKSSHAGSTSSWNL